MNFEVKATWAGGLGGTGALSSRGFESEYSLPRAWNGAGVGTNPEELLLAAAASCFLITLGAILDRRKIAVQALSLRSELETAMGERGPTLVRVRHRPIVRTPVGTAAAVKDAVAAAEAGCLIARAMRGQVQFHCDAVVEEVSA